MTIEIKTNRQGYPEVDAASVRDALEALLGDRPVLRRREEVVFATTRGELIRLYVYPYNRVTMRFYVNVFGDVHRLDRSEWERLRHSPEQERNEASPPRWEFSFATGELEAALRFLVAKVRYGEGTASLKEVVRRGASLGVEKRDLTPRCLATEWRGRRGYSWSGAGTAACNAYNAEQG